MKAPRFILMLVAVLSAPLQGAEPTVATSPAPAPKVAATPVIEGSDFLRFVEGDDKDVLETAIVRYVSPGGATVDLVGAVHIADKAYFDALNARFKTYDAVLYELVGRPIEERDTLKPGDGSEKLQWLGQVQETMRKTLKLESQLQCIDYKAPNFVHADMSLEGFFDAQDAKKETFLTLWMKAIQAQSGLQRDQEPASMLELIMILRQEDPSTELKRLVGQEFDSMEKLITGIESTGGTSIISERNKHALSVMDREIQIGKKKLAIFYGAAHLPDMEQRLLKRGFKLQKVDWVTAWNLPWSEE